MALAIGTNSGFVTVAPEADPEGTGGTMGGWARVTKDTSPATAGKITKIGWWCNTESSETNFEVGLYAADGATVPGEAGTLLEVERTNAKGTTIRWVEIAVDWSIEPNTDYWLGLQIDGTSEINYASSGGSGMDYLISQTTLPNPFGGGSIAFPSGMLALYAVWEEAPVGTNMKINIGDVFKDIESLKINIGNVWKDVVQVQQNIGDVWKNVFG